MELKILALPSGNGKVYSTTNKLADYIKLGYVDTGETIEVEVTDPSKEVVEMLLEDSIVTHLRYKGDNEWRAIAGTDTYKVKVDGTDTAEYLENKLVEGSNVTITKADKKLTINASGIALGETSDTAYRGDRGVSAYDHSVLADGTNPHATTFANIASKPTTIAGYGITDGVDTSSTQTIGGDKTFSNTLTANGSISCQWGSISADLKLGGGASTVPGYKINSYLATAEQSMFKFSNTNTGQNAADGFDVGITADGTAEIRQRENKPLNIYTNNTLLAAFNADGTTSNLSGAWTTISDARLKKDISDISNPIEKVESIAKCVKHYNFINQDKYAKGKRTGYIAQLLAENGLEGHVTQRTPNDEEEGVMFGWTYKDEKYIEVENEEEVEKTRRVVDVEGEMILGIENNFTPYLFPAFVALLERVKKLEEKLS